MTGTEKMKEVVAAAKAAIPKLTEDKAKLYTRLRLDKKTLAYIWPAGKGATRIDLYVEQASLPKSIKSFSPGRGRARKEGLIATLADSAGKREVDQVVEGLKVAAEFRAEPTEEETKADIETGVPAAERVKPEDELDADLKTAAAAADENARKAASKAKPDPKKKDKATA